MNVLSAQQRTILPPEPQNNALYMQVFSGSDHSAATHRASQQRERLLYQPGMTPASCDQDEFLEFSLGAEQPLEVPAARVQQGPQRPPDRSGMQHTAGIPLAGNLPTVGNNAAENKRSNARPVTAISQPAAGLPKLQANDSAVALGEKPEQGGLARERIQHSSAEELGFDLSEGDVAELMDGLDDEEDELARTGLWTPHE